MTSIPFVREFDFEYGRCDQLSPLIRRVVAQNPGPFTYTGTGVYIIGTDDVAVIDPGPVQDDHIAALDKALDGQRVTHVFVTHHHLDHSPLAHPLAQKHGAKVYGFGPQNIAPTGGEVRLEAGDDVGFQPDIQVKDEQVFSGSNWSVRALHTPGHTSNHVCYALEEENTLFCGDHVMAWSTSVISPPDGHMGDYLRELARIRDKQYDRLWPTHGPAVENPSQFIQTYIDHRLQREEQILVQLRAGLSNIKDMVAVMYADVDKRLHPAAAHSVLAHMIHLVETDQVIAEGELDLQARYSLPVPA
ncbi:MAG: MBL fold metallo-hydrolase [Maricaulis sp.]|uniref:MBL fold metallo-hydrolase n=1 Tax=Maricaulis sp. TaxID=1486257 RepID=UPI001B22B059|nr:MBL fold metallo-hydrolase [Maricaulis sp.]MBO6729133.1 MBL fold metallo-hydrolase [Maricaulis sp.]MBO6847525.1 MBL fold metallo-hydrolase [Maricaulis sp.]MBO6877095.1 MBL fold metallo-hydrolase [Maricaulis sp.]